MSKPKLSRKIILIVGAILITVVCFIFLVPFKLDVPLRVDEVEIGDWTGDASREAKNECLAKNGRLGSRGSVMTCYQLRRENVSLWKWITYARHIYESSP